MVAENGVQREVRPPLSSCAIFPGARLLEVTSPVHCLGRRNPAHAVSCPSTGLLRWTRHCPCLLQGKEISKQAILTPHNGGSVRLSLRGPP